MKPRSKSLETSETPAPQRSRSSLGEKPSPRVPKQKFNADPLEAVDAGSETIARVTTPSSAPKVSADEISRRAHEIWLREGQPIGRDREHWFRAENELRKERQG